MPYRLFVIVIALLSFLGQIEFAYSDALPAKLTVEVIGPDEKLKKNILAHLGELPTSDVMRRAFIFNLDENLHNGLTSLGYYHSSIEKNTNKSNDKQWQLTLNINPGDPTLIQWADIQITGDLLEDNAVNEWLTSQPLFSGVQLNHGLYEQVKTELLGFAIARGYFDAKYSLSQIKVNRDLYYAQVSLHLDSGKRYHMGAVNFNGHTLSNDLLQSLVPFSMESPYQAEKLGQLNSQLLETGYFKNIKVLPQVAQAQSHLVPIDVVLTPKSDHAFEVGLGADIGNTGEQTIDPRINFIWRTPQINVHGHSQETSVYWSRYRPKYSTSYTIPLTHPLNDQLKIKLGLFRDIYGVIQTYEAGSMDYQDDGNLESSQYLLEISRQQRLANNWLWGYSISASREDYFQQTLDFKSKLLILGTKLSKRTRGDNSLDPASGFYQSYSLEHADPTLGSDIRLTRIQANFKSLTTLYPKHKLVTRLDLGINITQDSDLIKIPPSQRYFAGGDQSIRGYNRNELGPEFHFSGKDATYYRVIVGGRYLAVASVEYQYYVTDTWRIASFVDSGNAFTRKKFTPVTSVGAGLHWISPVGPIKLDIGVGVDKQELVDRPWRIHLTMGTEL